MKIYNQGKCGSCYAFACSTNIQTNFNISFGYLVELSPQQGVDCGYQVDCHGCDGGLVHKLFKYYTSSTAPQAVATIASYPYIGYESYCKDGKGYGTQYGVRLLNWKGYYNATGMPESYILTGLKTGVVGGAVYCDETLWYAYSSGILTYD